MASRDFWLNTFYNLGGTLGNGLVNANRNRNRTQMDRAYDEAMNGGSRTLTDNQMAQNIGNMGRMDIPSLLANVTNRAVASQPNMSRDEMLRANSSLIAANGMPILSQGGNLIMNDKLMYEHYLNEGMPEVAQKYADHANWVRQNMEVAEPWLQSGTTASYADAQDYLNGRKLYSARANQSPTANQALQNTPQNINPAQATPQVAQTAPAVNSNVMANPTTAQAVAGNGYNFAAPSIGEIARGLANGGFYGNFLTGRR